MLTKLFILVVVSSLAFTGLASAGASDYEFAQWQHRSTDNDLFTFVTRPDLKPPRLTVALDKRERTAPGYIFVAPYDCLECSNLPATSHVTQQIGPLIYSQNGELVWSGTELFQGTKVFDFKPVLINGEHHLSLVAPTDAAWQPYPDGFAMVLNASYQSVFSVNTNELGQSIDMHDFNILGDGQTALIGVVSHRHVGELDQVQWKGEILEYSFTEFDLQTRQRFFDWTASDHVPFNETLNPPPTSGMPGEPWDWFQMNSMDKDKYGNYLVSARATNTIYYIAPDGSVIWRLGGLNSSFAQDFNFSRQSHARIRDQSDVNMVISFFDNAADDTGSWEPTSESSGCNVVGLDLQNMAASLYHRHDRPDGGLTKTNGNMQFLPNGGVFSGWGENGYMTEYLNRGGEKLYEASFASRRFANYRAYKGEFVGRPATRPITKAFVSTNARGQLRTAIYVSWNGATEVTTWRFYSHATKGAGKGNIQIGQTHKTGFETSFIAMGYHPVIFAEAVDAFGNSIANSSLEVIEIPSGFHNAEDPMYNNAGGISPGTFLTVCIAVAFIAGLVAANVCGRFRTSKGNWSRRSGPLRWSSKRKR